MTLFIALIAGLALFFNLRALAGRHQDAWWARLLFRPFGPRTDVRYMTRSELLRSGLGSLLLAVVIAALLAGIGFAFNDRSGLYAVRLAASFVLLILIVLFILSGLILIVRSLFRSPKFVPPQPAVADIEHTPYLAIDQSWYQKPDGIPEHVSCGGVVARIEHGNILIALLREDGFKNHVLPKGRLEKGESWEHTARREIAEESGITDLRLVCELGVRERLDLKKQFWKKTHYFLFLTDQRLGHPTDTQHTYLLEWCPLKNLPHMFWPEQQELIETNRGRINMLILTGPTP